MIVYKFVELSVVTEDSLEETVNRWVRAGWQLDAVRFVVTEHSRRPSMAFVSFIRESEQVAASTEVAAGAAAGAAAGGMAAAPTDPTAAPPREPVVDDTVPQDGAKLPRRLPRRPPPIELGEIELPEDLPLVEDPEPDRG